MPDSSKKPAAWTLAQPETDASDAGGTAFREVIAGEASYETGSQEGDTSPNDTACAGGWNGRDSLQLRRARALLCWHLRRPYLAFAYETSRPPRIADGLYDHESAWSIWIWSTVGERDIRVRPLRSWYVV
jgi:hypothetical protein